MDLSAKKRGFGLASSGLVLTVGILFLLDEIRFVDVTRREWGVLASIALTTVGGSWLMLLRGARVWSAWDPHFVLMPSVGVAILFSGMAWAADEARLVVLAVWPVVLIFLAGYVGFMHSAVLSGLMTAGYLTAAGLAPSSRMPLRVEAILSMVALVANLFAGTVLARIRRQRSDLAAARAELARLVNIDPLTGLPNRRRFDEVYGGEIARMARYGTRFSLALLDIDHFKAYNDRLGHPAGDDALRELGSLLQEELRSNDLVARLGGEEFAVVLFGADEAAALVKAERLRRRVGEHRLGSGAERLTISVGCASAPGDGVDATELFHRADEALYAAKTRGRDRVVSASDVQREKGREAEVSRRSRG